MSPKETSLIFTRLKESFTGQPIKVIMAIYGVYFIAIVVVLLLLLCVKTIRQRILEFLMSLKDGLSSIFKVKHYWGYLYTPYSFGCLIWSCLPYHFMLLMVLQAFHSVE